RVIDQGIVEGDVPLSPVQRWFFENNFTHSHHFNLAMMIHREKGFDEDIVSSVFKKIVEHHDALRMVYEFKGNKVIQENRGLGGELFKLQVFHEADIETEANHIQESIDLERGPLVQLGLFKTPQGDHLLMVIHHLVVDGISWRILLEDFALGYQQRMEGKNLKFQEKTDSFKYWTHRLKEYAESTALLRELDYWRAIEETGASVLPRDNDIPVHQRR
ncbi:MAG: hypothetical protein GY852_06340, partial [bacterium]|nr:hypothetical protein [bacterium]